VDVIITEWALDSYLKLKHRGAFTPQEYRTGLRPDVELLKNSAAADKRMAAVMQRRMNIISAGQHTTRGKL
jgi:hypothetical protein